MGVGYSMYQDGEKRQPGRNRLHGGLDARRGLAVKKKSAPHRSALTHAAPKRRRLQQHEQRQERDGGERHDGGDHRLTQVGTDRQCRLAQIVGVLLEPGRVLLHPGQQPETLQGVRQPAMPPLDLIDHGR